MVLNRVKITLSVLIVLTTHFWFNEAAVSVILSDKICDCECDANEMVFFR